jgi:hypothetical protein
MGVAIDHRCRAPLATSFGVACSACGRTNAATIQGERTMEGSFLPFVIWLWILVGTPVVALLVSSMTEKAISAERRHPI